MNAQKDVDFRKRIPQFIHITLCKAAGRNQNGTAAVLFILRHFQNGIDRFLLCGFDEPTRVDDQNVRLRRVRDEIVAGCFQISKHMFCIDLILGAAKGNNADLAHASGSSS